ncbi:MAG: F0F1 ATP synthase subunit delta [Candidatus Saccharimonadales bacterium]
MVSRRVLTRHIAKELFHGEKQSEVVTQLAAYIVEHRLQNDISQIVGDIARNLAVMGRTTAYVTTARPLDPALLAEVRQKVLKMESVEDAEIIELIDPAILGGVVIETPTKRFDASVAHKLKRLKHAV